MPPDDQLPVQTPLTIRLMPSIHSQITDTMRHRRRTHAGFPLRRIDDPVPIQAAGGLPATGLSSATAWRQPFDLPAPVAVRLPSGCGSVAIPVEYCST